MQLVQELCCTTSEAQLRTQKVSDTPERYKLYLFVKFGLPIAVTIAEYVCDDASKRIFKPSTHLLQVVIVKDQLTTNDMETVRI